MAVSSTTTTTICISGNNIVPVYQSPKLGFLSTNCFHVKPRRLCIRSSSDVSAETTDTEVESIEVPKEPPSLISALNVERALRGLRKFFNYVHVWIHAKDHKGVKIMVYSNKS